MLCCSLPRRCSLPRLSSDRRLQLARPTSPGQRRRHPPARSSTKRATAAAAGTGVAPSVGFGARRATPAACGGMAAERPRRHREIARAALKAAPFLWQRRQPISTWPRTAAMAAISIRPTKNQVTALSLYLSRVWVRLRNMAFPRCAHTHALLLPQVYRGLRASLICP